MPGISSAVLLRWGPRPPVLSCRQHAARPPTLSTLCAARRAGRMADLDAARRGLRGLGARCGPGPVSGRSTRHRLPGAGRVLVHERATRAAARPSDALPFSEPLAGAGAVGRVDPYDLYRRSHLAHHRDEALTQPGLDPESNYIDALDYERLPRWCRPWWFAQRTVVGRLLLGPAMMIGPLWLDIVRKPWRRDFSDTGIGRSTSCCWAACCGCWTVTPGSGRCSTSSGSATRRSDSPCSAPSTSTVRRRFPRTGW